MEIFALTYQGPLSLIQNQFQSLENKKIKSGAYHVQSLVLDVKIKVNFSRTIRCIRN